jgi:hypothetical protein
MINDDPINSTPDPNLDPIISQLTQRAHDLSLSIVNPATLAGKLRETLEETVGPDKATAYHIGATFDGEKVDFQIAYFSPSLLISLKGNTNRDLSLGLSWLRTTKGGWKVEVGVGATMIEPNNSSNSSKDHIKAIGGDIKASFSVTISK